MRLDRILITAAALFGFVSFVVRPVFSAEPLALKDSASVAVRAAADRFYDALREIDDFTANTENGPPEELAKLRVQAAELEAAARNAIASGRTKTKWNFVPRFDWENGFSGPVAGMTAIAAFGGALFLADHHGLWAATLATLGGPVNLFVMTYFRDYAVQKRIDKASAAKLTEVFWDRLKERGLPVPSKNRDQWLAALMESAIREVMVVRSPSTLADEIHRFRAEMLRAAELLNDQPERKKVIEGLIAALPKTTALRRFSSSSKWMDETFLALSKSKRLFRKHAEFFGLTGEKFDLNGALRPGFKFDASDRGALVDMVKPSGLMASRIVERAGTALVSPELTDLMQATHGSHKLELGVELSRLISAELEGPTGLAQLDVTLKVLNKKTGEALGETKFSVEFATSKSLADDIVGEGAWIEILTNGLGKAIREHKGLLGLIERQAPVRVCQELMVEPALSQAEMQGAATDVQTTAVDGTAQRKL